MKNKNTNILELKQKLDTLQSYQKYHKLDFIFPDTGDYRRELYKPHLEFMKAGATHRFRVFCGGNRSGKSFTMAAELAYHITGDYPEWWEGKRIKKLTTVWVVAESGALFRDSLQKLLFGEPGEDVGTGLLPLAEKNNGVGIIRYSAMQGTPGAIGTALCRHKKGHNVSIVIKTNEMSREQFQAAKVGIVAFDEEPREEIYTECLMRLMGAGKEPGILMMAFTPLKGLSNVVLKFLPNGQFPERGSPIDDPEKYICRVEWADVPHLSEQDKNEILKNIPPNERDPRSKGVPSLGSGRIYPIDDEFVFVKPFQIPDYWPRAFGLDFASYAGYTAAVWIAQDPMSKTKYVYAEYKRRHVSDEVHVMSIQARGKWIQGVADPSGGGRRDNGDLRLDFYRKLGLNLVPGENAFLTGIAKTLNEFESGKTKIFDNLLELKKEIATYRFDSKDPNVAARNQEDHVLDALRYLLSKFEWVAKSIEDVFRFNNSADNKRRKRNSQSRDSLTGY